MHAHGNDTGVRPAPTTGFDMLGSIGENSWEMPVMDTAGRATQWPHNARAMWPDGPCPSPGLPAVTHPGEQLAGINFGSYIYAQTALPSAQKAIYHIPYKPAQAMSS